METQARPEQDGAGESQIVLPMFVVYTSLTLSLPLHCTEAQSAGYLLRNGGGQDGQLVTLREEVRTTP